MDFRGGAVAALEHALFQVLGDDDVVARVHDHADLGHEGRGSQGEGAGGIDAGRLAFFESVAQVTW